MILKTDRDAGYRTLTVTWTPADPEAGQKALDEHDLSDGDHVDPEIYDEVRNTYADLIEDDSHE